MRGRGRELDAGARRPSLQDRLHAPRPTASAPRLRADRQHDRGGAASPTGRDFDGAGHGSGGRRVCCRSITTLPGSTVDSRARASRRAARRTRSSRSRTSRSSHRTCRRPGYPGRHHDRVRRRVVRHRPRCRRSRFRARPAKFRVFAHTAPTGDRQLDFRFRDPTRRHAESATDELIDILTYAATRAGATESTWRVQLDTPARTRGPIQPPAPATSSSSSSSARSAPTTCSCSAPTASASIRPRAAAQFAEQPYVVPNPYVGRRASSPQRFAISGRGERRMEFRALPAGRDDPHLHGARRSGADAAPRRLDRGLRGVEPAHQGQPRRRARPLRLPRRRARYRRRTSASSRSSNEARERIGSRRRRSRSRSAIAAAAARGAALAQTKTGTTLGQFLLIEPSARFAAHGQRRRRGATAGLDAVVLQPCVRSAAGARRAPVLPQPSGSPASATTTSAAALPLGRWGNAFASRDLARLGRHRRAHRRPAARTGERYTVSDIAIGLGYARGSPTASRPGSSSSYVQETIWNSSTSTATIDLGTLYRVADNGLQLGSSLSNFGTHGAFRGRDLRILVRRGPRPLRRQRALPGRALHRRLPGAGAVPRRARPAASSSSPRRAAGSRVDAFHPSDNSESVSLGAEFTLPQRRSSLRAGYQNLFHEDSEVGLTAGAGCAARFDDRRLSPRLRVGRPRATGRHPPVHVRA